MSSGHNTSPSLGSASRRAVGPSESKSQSSSSGRNNPFSRENTHRGGPAPEGVQPSPSYVEQPLHAVDTYTDSVKDLEPLVDIKAKLTNQRVSAADPKKHAYDRIQYLNEYFRSLVREQDALRQIIALDKQARARENEAHNRQLEDLRAELINLIARDNDRQEEVQRLQDTMTRMAEDFRTDLDELSRSIYDRNGKVDEKKKKLEKRLASWKKQSSDPGGS